ncbi:MAG: hypothetical protein WDN48_17630 [Pseudolabrys sp.]
MRALWRVSAWGCSAAIALAALAITTQTEVGGERLKLALGYVDPPSTAGELSELKQRVLDKEAQARRLESQVARWPPIATGSRRALPASSAISRT